MKKFITLALALIMGALISVIGGGCMAPYDVPEFKTITPSQTAYLVPLIGETSGQGKFNSKELLAKAKVATKEVQIPHRFVQTGRHGWQGEYRPTMTLIVVERKPVTRAWTERVDTGTSNKDDAIRAETRESIGFIAKMNCVAIIKEDNTDVFLFNYNDKALEDIMDQEIRAHIESKFVELAAKYYLRDENNGLLANKGDIMDKVRANVLPYFEGRGITITVLGLSGDFQYEGTVQGAINDRFIAKQNRAKAEDEADAISTIKNAGGLDFYLRQKELAISQQNADTYRKATDGWIAGGAKMPQAVGGGSLLQIVPQPPDVAPPPAK